MTTITALSLKYHLILNYFCHLVTYFLLTSHFAVFLADIMLGVFASISGQFPAIQNEGDTKATGVK